MVHKFSKLGVAMAALVTMFALSASASQASSFMTEGEKYPVTVSGNQVGENIFTVKTEAGKNSEVKCKKATFSGTVSKKSSEVTVHPTYEECTAFTLPATVTTTGCDFVLHSSTGSIDTFAAVVDVSCGGSAAITIKTATCHVSVGVQNGLAAASLTNNTAAGTISVVATITNIGYINITDGIGCPLPDKLSHTDGTYNGTILVSAKFEGSAIKATIE
jgi:hypothetical protein